MVELPWPAITAAGGGWLLFGLTAWHVIRGYQTGNTVPRSALDDAKHEAAEWRTEGRLKDAQIAEKDEQIRLLAEVGKTVEQLARGLQKRMQP